MKLSAVLLVVLLVGAQKIAADDSVRLTLLASGASSRIGSYYPQRAELATTKPATLLKLPTGLQSPRFAVLPIGRRDGTPAPLFHVVLDEPAGKPTVLYVDADGNGDLTNDRPAEWKGYTSGGYTNYTGGATIRLAVGNRTLEVHVAMYRFDPSDASRASYANTLFFYRDWAWEGEVSLGTQRYRAILSDEQATGDCTGKGVMLLIDLNSDGRFHNPRESFDVHQPFNIGGTTWEVADLGAFGDAFRLVRSSRTVAETVPPPDHRTGKKITAFSTTDMDGKPVRMPADYTGRIVLLDFWATWCGPCMAEVPSLVAAYKAFHASGFEVLGISLDGENQTAKIKSVLEQQGMSWPQVYDGKGWNAAIAALYAIDAIPAPFLVDGDTGEILAQGGELRGTALARTIEQALAKKKRAK